MNFCRSFEQMLSTFIVCKQIISETNYTLVFNKVFIKSYFADYFKIWMLYVLMKFDI